MSGNAIILSIRPKHAKKIIEGKKTVELRRVRPKYINKGALVLLYVSSPVKSLVGGFRVDQITEKPLRDLWEVVQGRAGILYEEFDAYFEGVSSGIGIFFNELWLFPMPIELQHLKELTDFQPPQSFRYATASELASTQFTELVGEKEILVQVPFLSKDVIIDRRSSTLTK